MYENNLYKVMIGKRNALDMKLLYNLIPLSLLTGWSSYAIAFKQGTVLGITNKFLQSGSTVFCTE